MTNNRPNQIAKLHFQELKAILNRRCGFVMDYLYVFFCLSHSMLHNHTSASFAKRYDKPLTNNNRSNQIAKLHFQEFNARTYIKKSGFVMNYLCAFFVSLLFKAMSISLSLQFDTAWNKFTTMPLLLFCMVLGFFSTLSLL